MIKAIFTSLAIQFKNDIRDKNTLLVYYIIPLIFYFAMGSILNIISQDGGIPLAAICAILALSIAAYLGLPLTIVKAREQGVMKAYRVAGIPEYIVPLCSIIIVLVHILIMTTIIVISAPGIFGTPATENLPGFYLTIILVALASEGLGVLLSSLVKKQSTMGMAGQILFLPSIMFTGLMFPASFLPEALQRVGGVLPAGIGTQAFGPLGTLWQEFLALAVISVAAFAVAALIFRRAAASGK